MLRPIPTVNIMYGLITCQISTLRLGEAFGHIYQSCDAKIVAQMLRPY